MGGSVMMGQRILTHWPWAMLVEGCGADSASGQSMCFCMWWSSQCLSLH